VQGQMCELRISELVGVVTDYWRTRSGRSVDSLVLVLITACNLICTCSARFILFHPRKHIVSLCTGCLLLISTHA
jgi:hypothetical protein